jgi:hypothetical protein
MLAVVDLQRAARATATKGALSNPATARKGFD